jgi:hypothetical protein
MVLLVAVRAEISPHVYLGNVGSSWMISTQGSGGLLAPQDRHRPCLIGRPGYPSPGMFGRLVGFALLDLLRWACGQVQGGRC